MKPNYLHIWPRNTFMMIALPNTVSGNFISYCSEVSCVVLGDQKSLQRISDD